MEERKAWLAGFVPGTYLDQSVEKISYSDFVNKARSMPHAIPSIMTHGQQRLPQLHAGVALY